MSIKGRASRGKRRSKAEGRSRRRTIPPTAVSVTFRHVDPTSALQSYAERKLGHISKFLKRAAQVHLILAVDKYRQHGEVTVKSGRLAVAAQAETKDLYSVIDLLVDKVERQLKSHLAKVKARKIRVPSAGEVLSAAETSLPLTGVGRG